MPDIARCDFAHDFLWDCSTSSCHIEGGASEGGRVESIWNRFSARPGAIRAVACDHYHRWPQDLDIGREVGLNAYRFSIALPRIFSSRGARPNLKGLAFDSRLVDCMLQRGLDPWGTLAVPESLQNRLDLYRSNGRIFRKNEELFGEVSWLQVMHGQHVRAGGYHPLADRRPGEQVEAFLADVRQVVGKCVDAMPRHAEFIAANCAA